MIKKRVIFFPSDSEKEQCSEVKKDEEFSKEDKKELRAIREELKATKEELKAAKEELKVTKEEPKNEKKYSIVEQKKISFEKSDMRKEGNTSSEEASINAIENVEELEGSKNVVNDVEKEKTDLVEKVMHFINGGESLIRLLVDINHIDIIREMKAEVESSQTINKRYCILSHIVEDTFMRNDDRLYNFLATMMLNYLKKYRDWESLEARERYLEERWNVCLRKIKEESKIDWANIPNIKTAMEDERIKAMIEAIQIFLEHMQLEKIVFIIEFPNDVFLLRYRYRSGLALEPLIYDNDQCMIIITFPRRDEKDEEYINSIIKYIENL